MGGCSTKVSRKFDLYGFTLQIDAAIQAGDLKTASAKTVQAVAQYNRMSSHDKVEIDRRIDDIAERINKQESEERAAQSSDEAVAQRVI